jgi:hypothetical protein
VHSLVHFSFSRMHSLVHFSFSHVHTPLYVVPILWTYVWSVVMCLWQVAVGFVKECGAILQDLTPQGLHGELEFVFILTHHFLNLLLTPLCVPYMSCLRHSIVLSVLLDRWYKLIMHQLYLTPGGFLAWRCHVCAFRSKPVRWFTLG